MVKIIGAMEARTLLLYTGHGNMARTYDKPKQSKRLEFC